MQQIMSEMERILKMPQPYDSISKLPDLSQQAKGEYSKLLNGKRSNVEMLTDQAIAEIKGEYEKVQNKPVSSIENEIRFLEGLKEHLPGRKTLSDMDAAAYQIGSTKDNALATIARVIKSQVKPPVGPVEPKPPYIPPKKVETVYRGVLCPKRTVSSKEDVEKYLEGIRRQLYKLLENNDGVKIE